MTCIRGMVFGERLLLLCPYSLVGTQNKHQHAIQGAFQIHCQNKKLSLVNLFFSLVPLQIQECRYMDVHWGFICLFPKPTHLLHVVNYGQLVHVSFQCYLNFFLLIYSQVFVLIQSYSFSFLVRISPRVVFFPSFEWEGRMKGRKFRKPKACPQFLTFSHRYTLSFDLTLR